VLSLPLILKIASWQGFTSCHFDDGEPPSGKDINYAGLCSELAAGAIEALCFCNGGERSAGGHARCSADRRGTPLPVIRDAGENHEPEIRSRRRVCIRLPR